MDFSARSRTLLGEIAVADLKDRHVAVFGIGGVGSYAAEALVRGGIGELTLYDSDCVDASNINRQLFALSSNVGEEKVFAAMKRLLSVRSDVKVRGIQSFYSEETKGNVDMSRFDYIIDAIDSVPSKLTLILEAQKAGVPIISAMGAGNKLDPTQFRVADIYSTSVCPLAKTMRKLLKEAGVESLKVVYSRETPVSNAHPPGSVSFVPPVAGLILAGEVIKDLIS